MNADPIIKDKPNAPDLDYKEGEIHFENVAFSHYIPIEGENKVKERKLLKDFSLKIKPGT